MSRIYETDRLLLKNLHKNEAARVLTFYEENKDHFEPWEPKREENFYSFSYQKALLTAENNLMTEGKLIRFWVFAKEFPNEILGSICFQNILHEPYRSCILGYKFDRKHLHQGYATESINRCIEIIFEEYHMHRIEAYIMENNKPSLRLIKHLCFQYEGLSCSYARVNGNWEDHRRYVLINPIDC